MTGPFSQFVKIAFPFGYSNHSGISPDIVFQTLLLFIIQVSHRVFPETFQIPVGPFFLLTLGRKPLGVAIPFGIIVPIIGNGIPDKNKQIEIVLRMIGDWGSG